MGKSSDFCVFLPEGPPLEEKASEGTAGVVWAAKSIAGAVLRRGAASPIDVCPVLYKISRIPSRS
jgi:hypothetical protein